ncbi:MULTISPECIES: hypothetical protein [Rhizobium]|uniref:Transmembrane protein n=1 Tax=Rhizobium rhododendri TaxID=2506430 RepID=A0ABY8IKU5_9HYPH|nr:MULTISPECIES: hypothetical protein [Rhizobium]MBZ5761446.1 hypothetical protein [Rhizobium sp. VS19-DR96]MBZ5767394.1 hypothetical protein [Rhizobium sp. VS19-DR129.2]MBZ5775157.1 hypothetical protein [Rhizobium sp. VS19-DRK62.2]MBZ5785878.1 hypothetical protein [Rhizobium sp. VS19-DR121]MBZ5803304.1 hypothetical protein [Rhizobium sp. VS19-DR181]
MINVRQIATAAVFGASILLMTVAPAASMPISGVTSVQTGTPDVIQVRNRSHHHDHHRRDHRFHGCDDYYDNNDQSGVLFKSFVTGTLFHAR